MAEGLGAGNKPAGGAKYIGGRDPHARRRRQPRCIRGGSRVLVETTIQRERRTAAAVPTAWIRKGWRASAAEGAAEVRQAVHCKE